MAKTAEAEERGILSSSERSTPGVRVTLVVLRVLLLVALAVSCLGPLLWLAKAAVTPVQAIIRDPLSVFTVWEFQWFNLVDAWNGSRIGQFLLNTAQIALGTVVLTLFVSLTCAYVLSVLRPRWAPLLSGAILATLFIPGVISLVPLYLTVLDLPPFGVNLLNSYWAIWLPAGANAVAILIIKRFFDGIPRELFDAARVDGAGPVRVFVSIVLPLSRPAIGVVALLSVVASWKDFLWPLIVISDGALQPISVALAKASETTTFNVQLAGMFLALLVPVALFILFQNSFLKGVSAQGGIKA